MSVVTDVGKTDAVLNGKTASVSSDQFRRGDAAAAEDGEFDFVRHDASAWTRITAGFSRLRSGAQRKGSAVSHCWVRHIIYFHAM